MGGEEVFREGLRSLLGRWRWKPTTSSATPARGREHQEGGGCLPGESGRNAYERGKEQPINVCKRSEQDPKIVKIRTSFLGGICCLFLYFFAFFCQKAGSQIKKILYWQPSLLYLVGEVAGVRAVAVAVGVAVALVCLWLWCYYPHSSRD